MFLVFFVFVFVLCSSRQHSCTHCDQNVRALKCNIKHFRILLNEKHYFNYFINKYTDAVVISTTGNWVNG